MHICISNQTTIGSDNGLLPGWLQAIIWTNAGILLIWPLGTNCSEIFIGHSNILIQENAFENVVCKMLAIWPQPQCVKWSHSPVTILFHTTSTRSLSYSSWYNNFDWIRILHVTWREWWIGNALGRHCICDCYLTHNSDNQLHCLYI